MIEAGIWVVLIPLIFGLAAFATGGRTSRVLGLVGSGLTAITAFLLVSNVWTNGVWEYSLGAWEAPLGISLRADGLSTFLIAMTAVVGLAISVYAVRYFGDVLTPGEHRGSAGVYPPQSDEEVALTPGFSPNTGRGENVTTTSASPWLPASSFWPLWLLLWSSLNVLFLSSDIFNLYVGLELLTLASVALIILERERAAVIAGLRYLLAAFLGSMAYLLGVALLYAEAGVLDLTMMADAELTGTAVQVAGGLMAVGLLLKAALFPLHFWLPAAHSSAPAPVSAALSALVVKAAFYLLIRLWFEVFEPAGTIAVEQMIGALGATAIIVGSFQAIRQSRLKMMIAYSTVAQVGYLFVMIPLAGSFGDANGIWRFEAWTGGLYHALSHGFAKASMFLAAGVILKSLGHDRVLHLAGSASRFPVIYLSFGIAGMSLMGLPPSAGFVGKWLMLMSGVQSGQWWWVVVLLIGGLLTAGYVAIVLSQALERDTAEDIEPAAVPKLMTITVFALAALSLLLGLRAAEPLEFLEIGAPFQTLFTSDEE
jgi:multicomponent Na+:H+ antiporter subunit D